MAADSSRMPLQDTPFTTEPAIQTSDWGHSARLAGYGDLVLLPSRQPVMSLLTEASLSALGTLRASCPPRGGGKPCLLPRPPQGSRPLNSKGVQARPKAR